MKMVSWERLMKSDLCRRLFASLGKHRFEDFSWASQRLDDSAARELACSVFSWFLRSLPYVPAQEFAWNSSVALRSKTPGIQDQELVRSAADHGLCDYVIQNRIVSVWERMHPVRRIWAVVEMNQVLCLQGGPHRFYFVPEDRFFMIFSWERSRKTEISHKLSWWGPVSTSWDKGAAKIMASSIFAWNLSWRQWLLRGSKGWTLSTTAGTEKITSCFALENDACAALFLPSKMGPNMIQSREPRFPPEKISLVTKYEQIIASFHGTRC